MARRQGVHAKPKPNGPIPDKQDGRNIGHWMPLDFFPLCRVLPRLHPAGKPVDDCLLRYRQMPVGFQIHPDRSDCPFARWRPCRDAQPASEGRPDARGSEDQRMSCCRSVSGIHFA